MKKVIVITGATKGLGYAIASDLEKDNIVVSLSRNPHEKEIPGDFMRCDITHSEEVRKCIDAIVKKYGKVDVLINSAGVMLYSPLVDASEEDFDTSFSVNVKGTFLMIKEVLPHMRKERSGYIINISSVRGITAATGKGIYSSTKFAVRALTETILLENKDYNIKATSICPGIVWTESTREKLKKEGLGKDDVLNEDDIVKTVRYLLSLSPKGIVREIVVGGRLHG